MKTTSTKTDTQLQEEIKRQLIQQQKNDELAIRSFEAWKKKTEKELNDQHNPITLLKKIYIFIKKKLSVR